MKLVQDLSGMEYHRTLTYDTYTISGIHWMKTTTPQPLYNTIVGVQNINCVSYTTVLYPNKNV